MSNQVFEWDPDKAKNSREKHGVSFELAQRVFADPLAVLLQDRVVEGEERFHLVGSPGGGGITLLVVVHTQRDKEGAEIIRIISARQANRSERRQYEEENG